MKQDNYYTDGVFQSRLSRRIFFNFVACALLPLIAMALIAFFHASYEMSRQTQDLLDREIKSIANGLVERILIQKTRMDLLAANIREDGLGPSTRKTGVKGDIQHWFRSAAVMDGTGSVVSIFGPMGALPQLTPVQRTHLNTGNMLILTPGGSSGMRFILVRQLSSGVFDTRYLWVEVESAQLWQESFAKQLPYGAEACLFDAQGQTLFESFVVPASLRMAVLKGVRYRDRGHFDHTIDGEAHYGSYRLVSLHRQFLTANWSVVLVQQKYELTRTLEKFKRMFPLVILVTLGVVVLLSINLIRNSLIPLKNLINGTHRIARKDFSGYIDVSSNDEFSDLAHAFNHMSSELDRQFRAMAASADVDRAILSNLDESHIVSAIIHGIDNIFQCNQIGVGILDTEAPDQVKVYNHKQGGPGLTDIRIHQETFNHGDIIYHFNEVASVATFDATQNPEFLELFHHPDIQFQAVVPVRIQRHLAAFIVLGYECYEPECQTHFEHVVKMADQMAVAMANATLCQQLNQSQWGALHALARAVDAKSPWTAGHTERVARTAQLIGEALEMDDVALDRLYRGGLLHDLGKIGVPAAILDNRGSLTDKEYAIIKTHPSIGARILEPIKAFKDVSPIVEQHHERFDGQGYPLGLSGDAIDLGARILAVADAFDALLSNRPYREGLPMEKVMEIIEDGSGGPFDPRIVEVFVSQMRQSDSRLECVQLNPMSVSGAIFSAIEPEVQKPSLKDIGK